MSGKTEKQQARADLLGPCLTASDDVSICFAIFERDKDDSIIVRPEGGKVCLQIDRASDAWVSMPVGLAWRIANQIQTAAAAALAGRLVAEEREECAKVADLHEATSEIADAIRARAQE